MNKFLWVLYALGPFAILVGFVSGWAPSWVENLYSRGVYSALVKTFSWSVSWIAFPVAELLIVAVVLALVALVVFGALSGWLDALSVLGASVSVAVFWFVFGWGLNYNRLSWAQNVQWNVPGATVVELEGLAQDLAHRAFQARQLLAQNEKGVVVPPAASAWDSVEIRQKIQKAYEAKSKDWPLLLGTLPIVKTTSVPDWYSTVAIAGIFIPFTSEPIVNAGPKNWTLPFAMAHESAHQRGWAREDEANFLAFFVLVDSSEAELVYSASSTALLYVASALEETPAGLAAWNRVRSVLDPGIVRDWKASFDYWKAFRGPLADAGQAVNDTYLKSQGQKDGVKSYGRMVDLLIAWKGYFSATIAHPSM